ncbi:MAG TPA: hypothetical protein VHD90_09690 [Phototrophicaceae bacterium]|nr:hypothetical protein [Phototrophicaceae bacterium]
MLFVAFQLFVGTQAAVAVDTGPRAGLPDTVVVAARTTRTTTLIPKVVSQPSDTLKRRRKAIELSDWYYRRLTIHRYVAYATVPVFAVQWAAGNELFQKGSAAPGWVKPTHQIGAATLATMFTVNTVTGAWNWWETRSSPENRVLRTIHAATMIGADAAFTYPGIKLSDEAHNSVAKRRQHRDVALSAMGVTIVSGVVMKLFNR